MVDIATQNILACIEPVADAVVATERDIARIDKALPELREAVLTEARDIGLETRERAVEAAERLTAKQVQDAVETLTLALKNGDAAVLAQVEGLLLQANNSLTRTKRLAESQADIATGHLRQFIRGVGL